MKLKKLPLGSLTFAEIIDQNFVYADKTKYIYDLINSGEKSYFLLRPRRFGKSLLLSTIDELFSGDRKRFNNLWIGSSDYDFPKLPVIHLNMAMDSDTPETLKKNMLIRLKRVAERNNLDVFGEDPDEYFIGLIQAASKAYNSQIVILIDEYDAPVTDAMKNKELAQANVHVLHNFFRTLKNWEVYPYVRFSFVTGLTR
jgi:hypothetical protein